MRVPQSPMVSIVVEKMVSFATKYDVAAGLCQLGVERLHCHPVRDSAFDRGGGFRQSESAVMVRRRDSYFFVRLLDDVILLVVIRSPMYFCRNLLLLSNLSCSSRTASMRLNMVTRDS